MPTTIAVSPGCGAATLSPLYVVTPAQVSGEASLHLLLAQADVAVRVEQALPRRERSARAVALDRATLEDPLVADERHGREVTHPRGHVLVALEDVLLPPAVEAKAVAHQRAVPAERDEGQRVRVAQQRASRVGLVGAGIEPGQVLLAHLDDVRAQQEPCEPPAEGGGVADRAWPAVRVQRDECVVGQLPDERLEA